MPLHVPPYHDRHNDDLLNLVPPDAHRVLELGCGTGRLAGEFRSINPAVHWVGIERDHVAADEAGRQRLPGEGWPRCDHVICGDVEGRAGGCAPIDCAVADAPYDVVVCGDVLEHLVDPWGVLRQLAVLLRPGGQCLACIPNVAHWTVLDHLLRDDWPYQAEGVFDRTHLRYFTRRTAVALFEQAGLAVYDVRERRWGNEGRSRFVREQFGGSPPPAFDRLSQAAQFLVRGAKPGGPAVAPMRIHAASGERCCIAPRLAWPLEAMATIPGVHVSLGRPDMAPPTDPAPDVLVQQRHRSVEPGPQHDLLKRGFLIVHELDDLPDHLDGYRQNRFLAIRAAHAVMCSTQAVADAVRHHNPEVAVFPNQLDRLPAWRRRLREPASGARVQLVYGALNREPAWRPLVPALNAVLAEQPCAIQVIHDRAFYEALDTPHKAFSPFLPYAKYRAILAAADIMLLPMTDEPFDQAKSDLKLLECCAEGCCALAQRPHYGAFLAAAGGGLGFRDPDEFAENLRRLAGDAGLRRKLARGGWEHVRDQRLICYHYHDRKAWLRSLLARKPELDAALLARCPELATGRLLIP